MFKVVCRYAGQCRSKSGLPSHRKFEWLVKEGTSPIRDALCGGLNGMGGASKRGDSR